VPAGIRRRVRMLVAHCPVGGAGGAFCVVHGSCIVAHRWPWPRMATIGSAVGVYSAETDTDATRGGHTRQAPSIPAFGGRRRPDLDAPLDFDRWPR
jgi:hypothetical protein